MNTSAVQALRLLEQALGHRELSSRQRQELQPMFELLADRLAQQAGDRTGS